LKAERVHYAKKDGKVLTEDDDDEETRTDNAERAVQGALEAGNGQKRKISDVEGTEGGVGGEVDGEEEDYEAKKRRVLEETRDIDADSTSDSDGKSDSDDDDDESDEEDESAELMRELAKIKAERAAAAAAQAEKEAEKAAEQREKDIALGNPLLNAEQGRGDFGVKRRWDDDVVFKNQGRGTEEKGKEKRFVNDLLRSDFHRRFMDKYVR
jgi:protein CWC15